VPPRKPANGKQARAIRWPIAAGAIFVFILATGAGAVRALPVPPSPPPSSPSPTPSGSPVPSNVLPFDASLMFVLDDSISSKSSQRGDIVHVHLQKAIVLNGREVVPAGTPAQIRVINSSKADILDTYGFVDIFFLPLQLPDGRTLALRAPTSRLAANVSGGHDSTVGVEDQIGDIFIPDYMLYQIFRKGKNFVLGPGAAIRARTEAKLEELPNGTLAIESPAPVANHFEQPHSSFPAEPAATPYGPNGSVSHHRPRSTPSPSPSPSGDDLSPSPSPSASSSPQPSSSP
jgi:hypothetical protein